MLVPASILMYTPGTPEFKAKAARYQSPRVREYVQSLQANADAINGGNLTEAQISFLQQYNFYTGNIG